MSKLEREGNRQQSVFISYAQADKLVAREIADRLQGAGLRVWFDEWAMSAGDSIKGKIENQARATDLLIVLLSPASVESHWIRAELDAALSTELRSRAVTVIPALIEDCEVPAHLRDRMYLDLRSDLSQGIERLIRQLGVVPDIDFSILDGRAFEELVVDLLVQLGFTIERQRLSRDSGFDFVASISIDDPFGAERREAWLVETKLYKAERVSLQSLRQMVGYMVTVPGLYKGLVVTNSQLTSVATESLKEISDRAAREVRVIDGTELRALLLRHPDVVARHFSRDANE